MLVIVGVVKEVDPLSNAVPPDDAAYQSIVSPASGVAESIKLAETHPTSPVPAGAPGVLFIVAITAVLVAEIQPVVVFLASA